MAWLIRKKGIILEVWIYETKAIKGENSSSHDGYVNQISAEPNIDFNFFQQTLRFNGDNQTFSLFYYIQQADNTYFFKMSEKKRLDARLVKRCPLYWYG